MWLRWETKRYIKNWDISNNKASLNTGRKHPLYTTPHFKLLCRQVHMLEQACVTDGCPDTRTDTGKATKTGLPFTLCLSLSVASPKNYLVVFQMQARLWLFNQLSSISIHHLWEQMYVSYIIAYQQEKSRRAVLYLGWILKNKYD